MLKALELIGFKSFAEKTRFEFPPGITVVVGPNGSGKSNIVDAIKWVLGEQSVKSLRGKEMADVIFNGSGGRRPLNSAEITLTFDNHERTLPVDAPEVHVTRRVYRSGEGEYLINRQQCRLRDIRDLFAGTGVAAEAYSVIEQGKVDAMLQSSPRERRLIFEEAAGISRFKTKKLEALRRLQGVEQNLLRLSDIVDEVENRLKAVRLQASKARRYRELADRLQELRTQVALSDWRALGKRLEEVEAEVASLQQDAASLGQNADAGEAEVVAMDQQAGTLEQAARARESQVAQTRERIASLESSIDHERHRTVELEEQAARSRRQLASMSVRAGALEGQLQELAQAIEVAEGNHRNLRGKLAADERQLTELTTQWDLARSDNQQLRTAHTELMRAATTLGNELGSLQAQLEAATNQRTRSQARAASIDQDRTIREQELGQLSAQRTKLVDAAEQAAAESQAAQQKVAEHRKAALAAQRELADLKPRCQGLVERAAVLEELEQRLEGLTGGVKDMLMTIRQAPSGPLSLVRGMLADLVQVDMEMAPPIEAALGDRAQYFVVDEGQPWLEFLSSGGYAFQGRVSFLRLDQSASDLHAVELDGQPGVVGRADRYVDAVEVYRPLMQRLLAPTWIVEQLSDAIRLSAEHPQLSYVTLSGELLAADGAIAVGPRHLSAGLISRRSELRSLRHQIDGLQADIQRREWELARLEEQLAEHEQAAAFHTQQHQTAQQAVSQHALLFAAAEHRMQQLSAQHAALLAEQADAEQLVAQAEESLADNRRRSTEAEAKLAQLESQIAEGDERLARVEHERQQRQRQGTSLKVELAKSEQALEGLEQRWRQFERDQQERMRTLVEGRQHLEQAAERIRQTEANILAAQSQLADAYLRKESLARESVALLSDLDAIRVRRQQVGAESQKTRARLRKLEEKLHKREMLAGEIRHERQTVVDRLRDDYAIDLAELAGQDGESVVEQQQREAFDQEVAELRRKLNGLGGVNLDALQEVDQLEQRFQTLSDQFNDLSAAKGSLEQIIGRINADSRRLFAETLDTVKGHFQLLFRKLFGGGQADIVLDEGVDILESGIEIVARPPGKEPRNISLLSGGEKTMTCVALLLSIFRSRPSPFCVLDEVDAALDEANIERFVGVLQEFLTWTQFIVVTHSKKTMTCASTLYGVTMQESGVSKRVSVRFEDVSENGEILRSADDGLADADDSETQAA